MFTQTNLPYIIDLMLRDFRKRLALPRLTIAAPGIPGRLAKDFSPVDVYHYYVHQWTVNPCYAHNFIIRCRPRSAGEHQAVKELMDLFPLPAAPTAEA